MIALAAGIIVLIALGMPIAFAILVPSAVYFHTTGLPEAIFAQRVASGTVSFPLLAIPFFILAGSIMHRGGIARRLIDVAVVSVGHLPAILAKTVSLQMVREGYPRGFAAVVAAVSGVLGPMIPPSIMMILYGLAAEVSIGKLFVAGVLPGLLIAACLLAANLSVMKRHNIQIPLRPRLLAADVSGAGLGGLARRLLHADGTWRVRRGLLPCHQSVRLQGDRLARPA